MVTPLSAPVASYITDSLRVSQWMQLSLLSSLQGNKCEHTHALPFPRKSCEDPQRGADFSRRPARDLRSRTGPSGCCPSVVRVAAMRLKAGGEAGSGVREAAGRE
jgi:hypothetical protein